MSIVVCIGVIEDESTDHNAVNDDAVMDKLETKMNGVKLAENEIESNDDKNVKKKRKKNFKKKPDIEANDTLAGKQQTLPPSIPISELYSNGIISTLYIIIMSHRHVCNVLIYHFFKEYIQLAKKQITPKCPMTDYPKIE